ncbi:GPI inositol-deacylase [Aspergillus luchuensis]|uniref:GPI inositol-deacylase n=1 Tax=Aspergillus kawachii TaxID=1069201 RepID=A0A146FJH8_ASPKA|nr:GPI inositol-deacylase [Aspergillus luchuensis]
MDQMGKRSSEGGWMEVRLALEVQHSRQGGIPDVEDGGEKKTRKSRTPAPDGADGKEILDEPDEED